MAGDKDLPAPKIEGDVCVADPGRPQTKTQFIDYSLKELKQMLEGTNPGAIEEVGRHWGKVNEILSGGEGGGIAGLLDKAVDNVLEHWEGEAATSFEKKAREISQSLRNAAWHADLNSSQMADAGSQLRNYKEQLDNIEEPSGWAKVGDALSDWKWDNGEAVASDLQDRKLTAKEVAEINEGKIGASREAQLNGVAVMENLGAQYMRITRNFQNNKVIEHPPGNVKDPNREVEYPPPVTPVGIGASRPSGSGAASKPWSAGRTTNVKPAPAVPRDGGITGGAQVPSAKTKVDSISPGLTGTGPGTNTGGPSLSGGGVGTGGSQSPGIMAPGGGAGAGRGTAARGGIGAVGGRGGVSGAGAAAGRGAGGRSGMGGMGGAGAGAAGRGGAGAGGRGALAKSRGGVVGAAKGITGKGAGGGAGLHGSRGGTQRGAMAGGAGGMVGRNGRRSEDENSRGDRPDYLVEDEETWISEEDRNRNVPRTIE
ncbi:WXG100 family type VII secretion target [Streptomyces sp. NPDC093591]|uniref:WXG100 family type VII secretion target n=1 Tax=Streptomyces sp. NPDC093591 TaxID=3366044 RepID=UPI00380737C1